MKPISLTPTYSESDEADLDAGWDLDAPTRPDQKPAPIPDPPRKTSGQFVVSSRCKVETAPPVKAANPLQRPATPSERPEIPPPPGRAAMGTREEALPTAWRPPFAGVLIPARAGSRPVAAPPEPASKGEPVATRRYDSAPPVIEVAAASEAELAALMSMEDDDRPG